jgi:hypothetical protein
MMKSKVAPLLTFALLLCLGAWLVQRHVDEKRFARQELAIAAVQAKYDALLRESQAAKRVEATRKLSDAARAQARTLAPRYDALNRITGYAAKKTARN